MSEQKKCLFGQCDEVAVFYGPLESELADPKGGTYVTYACAAHTEGMAVLRPLKPSTADKLRRVLEIAEGDPSMVGGTITAFAPLITEAADTIDRLSVERKRFIEAMRSMTRAIQRSGSDIYVNGEWWATPRDALMALGVTDDD